MAQKTVITCCMTGTGTPKSKNPALPTQPKEIAEDAYKVWKAGASIVHLHMRDENNVGTMDAARFRETVSRIKDLCGDDLIINLTSSGAKNVTDDDRLAHIIELKPEICSFDSGTFNWLPNFIFENSPGFLRKLGQVCIDYKIKPEIEVFDAGMLYAAQYFQGKEKILPEGPMHVQFVLGVLGMGKADPQTLCYLKDKLPEGWTWAATGIGPGHLPIMYTAIALGGNLRVGLEDNLYYSHGQLATNEMLVERAKRAVELYGGEVATPDEAREIYGLRKKGE